MHQLWPRPDEMPRRPSDHLIEFGVCDFAVTEIPDGPGIIVMNPEYGMRLGEVEELKKTYRRISDFFKQKCTGYTGYIFTGNPELSKTVALRTSRRISFFNGDIECRLLKYELYSGTRKHCKDKTCKDTPQESP